MKIGIIGAGNVGGALGVRWAKTGYKIIFSSRHPQSDSMRQLLEAAGGNATAASPRDAAAGSEILLLAVSFPAARDALLEAGDLRGYSLIDATNPLLPDLSGLALGTNTSAAEQIASWHPKRGW